MKDRRPKPVDPETLKGKCCPDCGAGDGLLEPRWSKVDCYGCYTRDIEPITKDEFKRRNDQ